MRLLASPRLLLMRTELERVLKTERALLAALDLERHQRRAAAHLLGHHGGLRMVRPAGIDQPRHLRMLGQRLCDTARGVGLRADPHRQCLQAFQHDPGVERRQRRTGLPEQDMNMFLDELFGREDDAAKTAALAVDMFGRGIDHAIGAERERRLKKRRCEHVVDYERRACFMRDIGNRRDVDDLERRWSASPEEVLVFGRTASRRGRDRCRRPGSAIPNRGR